jgi:tetratricopeptide (TPR) repeat protein
MWSLAQLAWSLMADIADTDLAGPPLDEAEAILAALGPDYYAPDFGLRVRGLFAVRRAELCNRQGHYLEAIAHARASIGFYEASGLRHFANMGHTNMGVAYRHLGQYAEARAHLLTTLQLIREMGSWNEGHVLLELAFVDLRQGKLERAQEYSLESIRQAELQPNRNIIARNLGLLAALNVQLGHPLRAARLSGASAAMFARQQRTPWEDTSLDALLPGWRAGPNAAALSSAYDAGLALSNTEAVAYALDTRRKPGRKAASG